VIGDNLIERFGLVAAWVVMAVVFSITVPSFRQSGTFDIIFGSQATQLVVTFAVVIVLAAGEFDLSVANVLGVSAVSLVYLNTQYHWPFLLALVVVLIGSIVFGSINALITVGLGVPSIVVTLGTGTLISGVADGWAGESPIGGASVSFVNAVSHKFLGLPVGFWIAFVIGVVLYFILEHTPLGRHLLFVGRSQDVARLAGVRVNRIRAGSLIACSLLSAIAGILLVGLTGSADPNVAASYLLPAFAGAFLGSTTIKPGQFNIVGSFIAVYFLVTGVTALQILGYTGWVQDVFYGGSLVAAVVITQLLSRQRARALRSVGSGGRSNNAGPHGGTDPSSQNGSVAPRPEDIGASTN
jgi:ribose transport system permease protein